MRLTAARLRELLSYDPETGIFTRRIKSRGVKNAGDLAGGPHNAGYWNIAVDGKRYLAHRLAWLYVYEAWPPIDIDHINMDRCDNRISNLRLSSRSENQSNSRKYKSNTSGYKGVSWDATKNKWQATITKNYKTTHLGRYDTPQEAHAAYVKAAKQLHGKFARTE